jgi:zinc finger protein
LNFLNYKVESPDDLRRDVFKSESARLLIPEIDLELEYGTLGGR